MTNLQYKVRNYPTCISHFVGTAVTYRRKTVSAVLIKQPGHAATVTSCSLLIAFCSNMKLSW